MRWLPVIGLLAVMAPAHAGLLSGLGKLGRLADDVDAPKTLARIDLPEDLAGAETLSVVPVGGEWKVRLPDGTRRNLADYHLAPGGDSPPPVLVIRSLDLPADLQALDRLPADLPILVRGRGQAVFALQRSPRAAIGYKGVRVAVADGVEARNAIWHLQRPVHGDRVRIMGIGSDPGGAPRRSTGNPDFAVESIGADSLRDSLKPFRYQTLVLGGTVRDGRLFGGSDATDGIPVDRLRDLAEAGDVNLVILDSSDPGAALRQLSVRLSNVAGAGAPHTTGDFFARFVDPKGSPLTLSISPSGNTQTAIVHAAPGPVRDASVSGQRLPTVLPLHLLVHGATIFRPDEERSRELDRRMIEGVASWIPIFLAFSAFLGIMVPGSSHEMWSRVWALAPAETYSPEWKYYPLWLLHKFAFIFLYLPLLGWFTLPYLLLRGAWRIFHFLVVRPVLWVCRRVSG